jgi:uncharacterized membrane protein
MRAMQANEKIYLLLFLLCITGVFLRLYNLDVKGLWLDEIHSAYGADPDKTVKEVLEYSKGDQPPLYFLILHGWFNAFSYNDVTGRVLSIVIAVLGIISVFFLGKEFKNARAGLIVSFLTVINYFHIYHSREVRFYPLVFLLSTLSYLFFLRALKNGKLKDFIFYALTAGALLNTHYFGLVVFASQFILFAFIIFWKKITDIKFISYGLLSGILAGLSFAHWLPVVFSDLGIPEFHVRQMSWDFPLEFYWIYFRDDTTRVIIAILSLISLRLIYLRLKKKTVTLEDIVLIGWIFLGFMIPLLYSILRMPILEYKYTFIVLPALLLIAGLGLESISYPRVRTYILVLLFFSFLNAALFVNSLYFMESPPELWRETTKAVMKTESKTQYVLSTYAWYFRYYFKIYHATNQPLELRYVNFDEILPNAKSLWILISTRYPDEGMSADQKRKLSEAKFSLKKRLKFSDGVAEQYIKQ